MRATASADGQRRWDRLGWLPCSWLEVPGLELGVLKPERVWAADTEFWTRWL